MPGRDRTGPLGLGPMTGRGMGYCMMRLPSSVWEMGWGYAGLPAWRFVSVPGWRGLPGYPLLSGSFVPLLRRLFPSVRPPVSRGVHPRVSNPRAF